MPGSGFTGGHNNMVTTLQQKSSFKTLALQIGQTYKWLENCEHECFQQSKTPVHEVIYVRMGLSSTLILAPNNEHWRKMRKMVHLGMGHQATMDFMPIVENGAQAFIHSLLQCSDSCKYHETLRKSIGQHIIQFAYGIHSSPSLKKHVALAEDVLEELNYAIVFGSYLVDAFPVLKYLPRWMPGAHFKMHAAATKKKVMDMIDLPFQEAMQTVQTVESSSVLQKITQQFHINNTNKRLEIKWAVGSLYGAGTEPIFSALTVFILAMVSYPQVQHSAHLELDHVIGPGCVPKYEDWKALPYINAIIWETLRWHPPIPLGVPHYTKTQQWYKDYCIPAHCTAFVNIWGLSRDTDIYQDPEIFSPERFLGPKPELCPEKWVFGFGRRSCVGSDYALHILYMYISAILYHFDITVPKDSPVLQAFSPNTNSSLFS
ncbi:cytochrome P450 [Lentinula edodes]|nr:cytochrome P450 [Lentinula edodes]